MNEYRIVPHDEDERQRDPFRAFNKDVPEEIAELINMSEINWQRQFDAPFLLSESSGEVARRLNKIVNLDVIDSSLTKIQQKVRAIKNELEHKKEYSEELDKAIEELAYVDDLEEKVIALEELDADLKERVGNRNRLHTLFITIGAAEEAVKQANEVLAAEEIINRLTALDEKKQVLEEKCDRIDDLGKSIQRKSTAIKICEEWVALDEIVTSVLFKQQCRRNLSHLLEEIEELELDIASLGDEITRLEEQMPELCETCGNPI